MKTQLLKKLSLLLCVCLLLPFFGCANSGTQTECPSENGELIFTLAPQGSGKYAVSALIKGLSWGMSYEDAAKVVDFSRGRAEDEDIYITYTEYYPNEKLPDAAPYTFFGQKVTRMVLKFYHSAKYQEVSLDGGLCYVQLLLEPNAEKVEEAEALQNKFTSVYGTEYGNPTREYLAKLTLGPNLAKNIVTDMAQVNRQEYAVIDWVRRLGKYDGDGQAQTELQAALKVDTQPLEMPDEFVLTRISYSLPSTGETQAEGMIEAMNQTQVYDAMQKALSAYSTP